MAKKKTDHNRVRAKEELDRENDEIRSGNSRKREERQYKQHLRKERQRVKYGDDSWKSDFRKFSEQIARYNLYIKDVAGDGNCLFRAVSDQIDGQPENYDKFRQLVVDFIEKQREMFEPFIEDDIPFERYCAEMRKNATWGGHIEIQAMSLVLGVNIVIHQLDSPRWEVNNYGEMTRSIHLSYHRGDHYASVRPMGQVTGIPAEVKLVLVANGNNTNNNNKEKDNRGKGIKGVGGGDMMTVEEKIIMDSTGCDLELVRNTLIELSGDVDATIEYLIAMKQVEYSAELAREEKKSKENSLKSWKEEEEEQEKKLELSIPEKVSPSVVPVKTENSTKVPSTPAPVPSGNSAAIAELNRSLEALRMQESMLIDAIQYINDYQSKESMQGTLDRILKDQEDIKKKISVLEEDHDFAMAQEMALKLMLEEEEYLRKLQSEEYSDVNKTSSSSSSKPFSSSSSSSSMENGSNNNERKLSKSERRILEMEAQRKEREERNKGKAAARGGKPHGQLTSREKQKLERERQQERKKNRGREEVRGPEENTPADLGTLLI